MTRLLLAISLFCVVISAEAQITLSVSPINQSVAAGSTAAVDIYVSGLPGGATGSIGAFDFDVDFDSTELAFQSATFGTGLDVFGLGDIQSATQLDANTIDLFEVSLDSASDLANHQPSSFRLTTLDFSAIAPGASAVNLVINALGDANGDSLSASVAPGSITVGNTISAVPEPGTFALMLVGVAGLAAARRFSCPGPVRK